MTVIFVYTFLFMFLKINAAGLLPRSQSCCVFEFWGSLGLAGLRFLNFGQEVLQDLASP